ncbi:MAG TPA: alkaline phosphatase family protein [Sphingobacteriaceae bacterium]|nr:alkaline phosphatase family protein [Sphingobacteriaceae bacterium]
MKLKLILLAISGSLILSANAQQKPQASAPGTLPRPKLVIGLMVDQMRWDYLYRYYERYGSGGFKRLLNEGFTCENTYINYIPSVTGVGHSTVYTGSVPAIHGIAANDFIIQATGKSMYCAEDSTVQTVGSTSVSDGKMSPRNLLVTTMTDELRLATNFRSKVIGIALKDRGSILPAGHTANAAYWYDENTGNWITSTYYMNTLPPWVTKFNEQKLPEKYMKQNWNTLYPINTYVQSTKDDSPYEGKFAGAAAPVFPVMTSTMRLSTINTTPYGSTLTLDLAKAAVENEGMGADAITDFLAVSVSSPDYVGHQFGPNSIEVEDTYLRLDRDIASFLTFLDAKVGKGNYSLFLTADHGAYNNVNFLTDNKINAGLFPAAESLRNLNAQLEQQFKVKGLVINLGNYQVNLNNPAIAANKLDEAAVKKAAINFMKKVQGVLYVIDMADVQNANIPSAYKDQIINGYNAERSGAIQLILKPGWYSGSRTGTTHGTISPYDTHIPLVFMGWGIKQGKSNVSHNMTDIAATMSALLRIQEPSGNIGKPITEVLK